MASRPKRSPTLERAIKRSPAFGRAINAAHRTFRANHGIELMENPPAEDRLEALASVQNAAKRLLRALNALDDEMRTIVLASVDLGAPNSTQEVALLASLEDAARVPRAIASLSESAASWHATVRCEPRKTKRKDIARPEFVRALYDAHIAAGERLTRTRLRTELLIADFNADRPLKPLGLDRCKQLLGAARAEGKKLAQKI